MKYGLSIFLLVVGIVCLSGIALIILPATFVIYIQEFRSRGEVAVSGAWGVGLAIFLLWVVRQAWNEIVRLHTLRVEQKLREASYDLIPSWGKPPPPPSS